MAAGTVQALGQATECEVRKQFPADRNTELIISNKFGNITFMKSNVDSVYICGTTRIDHSNQETGQKSLDLITMDISVSGDTLRINTIYDDRFFSSPYKTGRKGYSVNYTINVPVYINIDIENSFGNISLEDCEGRVKLRLSHGNLTAGSLARGNEKPLNNIDIKHSNVKIANANWLIANLQHCPSVEISQGQALLFTSEYSTITLPYVNSVVLDSKSDLVSIGRVTNFVAETWITKAVIGEVADILRITSNLSTIRLNTLSEGFSEVELTGQNSSFVIGVDPETSFRMSAIGTMASIDVRSLTTKDMKRDVLTDTRYRLSGHVGKRSTTLSTFRADISNGKLEIIENRGDK